MAMSRDSEAYCFGRLWGESRLGAGVARVNASRKKKSTNRNTRALFFSSRKKREQTISKYSNLMLRGIVNF